MSGSRRGFASSPARESRGAGSRCSPRISALPRAASTVASPQEPRERLKALIQLYSERLNPEGMAIELAIRQWARADENAAAAAASVDAARLEHVTELYRATGLDAEEAEAQAFLF